eukprot:GFKZ01006020.1.p1 GENE.GFKZ01006020.1~~GFKZ01006020.1.p1  ORF type:complete len:1215 (-),score=189.63 GFKZ01006020.1:86-3730(-)
MTIPVELALRTFILDYLNKRGLNSAAEALRADHMQKEEQPLPYPPPVQSPNGFLFDFFGMFWDVFSARLNARIEKSRIRQQQEQQQHQPPHQQQQHPNPHQQQTLTPQQQHHHQQQLHQSSQQNQHHRQQHQPPHPQQHPQHSHPHQQPQHVQPNHQQQHVQPQPSAPAPQPSSQQSGAVQPPNPQQGLLPNISVDAALPVAGTAAMMQPPGPMSTANMAQNPNLFVNQHRQRPQAHASQPVLHPHAFRNAAQNIPNPQSQLQQQQLRHRKLQQQHAIMQSSHRQQPPVTSGSAQRMRVSSADNRRTLQQSQLAVQSLSLESSLQGQRATPPSEQAAAALSSDALDANGALDSVLSSVGTRTTPPRTSGTGAAPAVAVSRSMMPQMAGRTQSAQLPTGSNGVPIRGGSVKSRQYGLPAGSDAPSSASRRGAMDISVNVGPQYDDAAVEDESQPRTGGGRTSSGGKKRSASQNISRKSPGSSRTDALSPRGFGASEGGGPAKRQRAAGLYAPTGADAPMIQQLQHQQKPLSGVDIEQISRGLGQAHGTLRGRTHLMAFQHQRQQQAFAQSAEQVSNAQFLSQIASGDKSGGARNVGRYVPRPGGAPNPTFAAHEHGVNNRQREAYISAQMSAGRRTAGGGINERENNGNVEGRGSSRVQKGSEGNFAAAQAADQAGIATAGPALNIQDNNMSVPMNQDILLFLERQIGFIPNAGKMNMPASTSAFPGLTANLSASKKAGQNVSGDGNLKDSGRDDQVGVVGDVTKQHNDAQISDHIQRDSHMPLDSGGLKDDAGSMHIPQAFNGNDLLKSSSAMQITEQDIAIVNEKKSKSDANVGPNSKQSSGRGEIRRTGSSRAMKTIETTDVSRTLQRPDSGGKANGLSGSAGAIAQSALGTMGAGSKRDKGSGDLEVESRSTKSDRQGSGNRGGGTPSQKSTASGGSGAVDVRGTQGTSSTARRGRVRSRGRGSSGRRSRAERAPPRGSAAGRTGSSNQPPRTSALDQNVSASAGMPLGSDAGRGTQNDVDERTPTSAILAPPRGNVQNVEARVQSQKAERNRLPHGKANDSQAELGSVPKLGFETEASGNNENRGQAQQSGSHLHSDGGPLLEMLPQPGSVGAGRGAGDDTGLDSVEKEFTMQQLGLVAGNGTGKLGGHNGSNYNYDLQQYLAEDETDIGNMLHSMQGHLALDAGTDFEDDNILGVTDPGDLGMTGRNRG